MPLPAPGKEWQTLLDSLQHRNGLLEVTGIGVLDSPVVPTYRTRLLRFDETGILIERPQGPGVARYLGQGMPVSILAAMQNHRWELLSEVMETRQHQLNASTSVVALHLAYPWQVHSAQRRQFFRVAIRGRDVEPVLMLPQVIAFVEPEAQTPEPQEEGVEPAPPIESDQSQPVTEEPIKAFRARVVNVSGGGMGVLAGASVAGQLTRVVSYDCRVKLPTFTDLLTMPVRVAHLQPHNNGTSYLGLSLDDERGDTKPFADELCRFSAWYQRRLIAQIRQRH